MQQPNSPVIAVLLPCCNEAPTVGGVVKSFREALPEAEIYVFDNNSQDNSAALAREAGAQLRHVDLQGKGNVVRRMFADIEADVYLMADADGTYDASRARELTDPIVSGEVDTVMASRIGAQDAFRRGHVLGNRVFNVVVGWIFRRRLQDIFTGYRAFSRRFVKSFPAHSEGFDIEAELSIFALEQRIPMREIPMDYASRPQGSASKLRTYRDGLVILTTIVHLFKEARPLTFFTWIALLFAFTSLALGIPVIQEFRETGLVPRQPTAILATGLAVLSALSLVAGLLLDSVARAYRETRHLRYLTVPPRQAQP